MQPRNPATSDTPEPGVSRRSHFALAALLLSLLVTAVHWSVYSPYTIDDAYISYRYAENLAAGNGLVYNVGERVEGYTNFLWVVLLAAGGAIGLSTPEWAKLLGLALSVGCVMEVYLLAGRLPGGSAARRAAAPLLLATSGLFAASGVDGLETQLLALLVLVGAHRYVIEMGEERKFPWSSLAFLGAALTRPDGSLFFAAVLVHRAVGLRRLRFHRHDALMALLFFVPLLGYFIWRYQYYGYLLPNTYYAKEFATATLVDRGLYRFGVFVWHLSIAGLPLVALGVLTRKWGRHTSGNRGARVGAVPSRTESLQSSERPRGLKPAAQRHGTAAQRDHAAAEERRRFACGSLVWLLVGARLVFAILAGGAWMGWEYHRLFLPAVPLICLLAAEGLEGLASRAPASKGVRGHLAGPMLLLAIGANVWVSFHSILPGRYAYAEGLALAHEPLGVWLRDNAPSDSVLACGDAGAIPYFSGLTTIDVLGLNDNHIAHLAGGFYEKLDPDYIMRRKPDYVVVLSARQGTFHPRTNISALLQHRLAQDERYELLTILMFDEHYYLWVYMWTSAPRKDEG